MDMQQAKIKKLIKLDPITTFFKFISILSILFMLGSIIKLRSEYYLQILLSIICIIAYKLRIRFLNKQFKSYEILCGRILKMNKTLSTSGFRRITYSYKYKSNEYKTTSTINDFIGDSRSIKSGDFIKIILNKDNPSKSKILDFHQ